MIATTIVFLMKGLGGGGVQGACNNIPKQAPPSKHQYIRHENPSKSSNSY